MCLIGLSCFGIYTRSLVRVHYLGKVTATHFGWRSGACRMIICPSPFQNALRHFKKKLKKFRYVCHFAEHFFGKRIGLTHSQMVLSIRYKLLRVRNYSLLPTGSKKIIIFFIELKVRLLITNFLDYTKRSSSFRVSIEHVTRRTAKYPIEMTHGQ